MKKSLFSIHPVVAACFKSKALLALASGLTIAAPLAQAADDQWWFDIEVIVFERNLESANILEQFEQSSLAPATGYDVDLLTPYLNPDLSYLQAGLPYCRASKRAQVAAKYQQDFAFPLPPTANLSPVDDIPAAPQVEASLVMTETIDGADNFAYETLTQESFTSLQAPPDTLVESEQIVQDEANPEQEQALTAQQEASDEQIGQPIAIDIPLLEWQLPSVFPCVYSEQVDAVFVPKLPATDSASIELFEPAIAAVPRQIDGIEKLRRGQPFLLPKSTYRMQDLFDKISKQRDIQPILQVNWRQQVLFGRNKAKTFRLFAGKNYAGKFDQNGQVIVPETDSLMSLLANVEEQNYVPLEEIELSSNPVTDMQTDEQNSDLDALTSEALLAKIDAALNDDQPIDFTLPKPTEEQNVDPAAQWQTPQDIWQLDGGIKVYLQNVGRVPYLHIDNQLDYRHPVYRPEQVQTDLTESEALDSATELGSTNPLLANYLQSVRFEQLRRVISKQVHYFDHPLFGMIIRIHRFRWPEPEQESEE